MLFHTIVSLSMLLPLFFILSSPGHLLYDTFPWTIQDQGGVSRESLELKEPLTSKERWDGGPAVMMRWEPGHRMSSETVGKPLTSWALQPGARTEFVCELLLSKRTNESIDVTRLIFNTGLRQNWKEVKLIFSTFSNPYLSHLRPLFLIQ